MVDPSLMQAGKGRVARPQSTVYFHSITGEPLLPNASDPDSEDEDRDSWFQQSELADIDDYDDLQEQDKAFFKAISQSIRKDMNSSDRHIKEVLINFVKEHRDMGKALRVYLALLFQKNILSGDDTYHVLLEMRKQRMSP